MIETVCRLRAVDFSASDPASVADLEGRGYPDWVRTRRVVAQGS